MNRPVPMFLALGLAMALHGARAQDQNEAPIVRMVRGQVVAVDPARRLVLVKHDEVRSLGMPQMQMEYLVPEGSAFPELSAGDKVRLAVVRSGGGHVVTRVAPLPPARGTTRRLRSQGAVRADP